MAGWLNVDIAGSDFDVDLGVTPLPWSDGAFRAVVSQHVIEHLHLQREVLPLLRELRRVTQPGGEIWLSCPDLEKVCRSYAEHGMTDLIDDRRSRYPDFSLGEIPASHMVNLLFHQEGEHKNLFDFALLSWALLKSGFVDVTRVDEAKLLARFPGFPARGDDRQSLYVSARAGEIRD